MIYLLSQIVLALILAAFVGGALGWLLHRTTQDREAGQLRNAIQRQRQQVAQLNSEIAMLTDDYDELQRQSHDEIQELREANQQIPRLNSNLEKSQLLVSQMIKRHESEIRDLNSQNQNLTQKLKDLEAREQVIKRQQADLDSARRELGVADSVLGKTDESSDGVGEQASGNTASDGMAATTDVNTSNDQGGKTADAEPGEAATADADSASNFEVQGEQKVATASTVAAEPSDAAETTADAEEDHTVVAGSDSDGSASTGTNAKDDADKAKKAGQPSTANKPSVTRKPVITSTRNVSSWASAPLVEAEAETETETEANAGAEADSETLADADSDAKASADSDAKANANANANANINIDVDEGVDAREADADQVIAFDADSGDAVSSSAVDDQQTPAKSSVIFLNADAPLPGHDSRSDSSSGNETVNDNKDDSIVDPFDQVIEIDEQLLKDIDSDMEDDEFLNSLDDALARERQSEDEVSNFEPVEQQDDLQQIVGIGPETEKALNEMGISSFAQLARLEHHEIETIASALQIVPDSIERDDWVGNARRQLEDVLEEL